MRDDSARTEIALRIWRTAILAVGTPVEVYLQSRGILVPPPTTLRFHRGIKHPSGGIWPAMVALVTRGTDDTPLAIHRTDSIPARALAAERMRLHRERRRQGLRCLMIELRKTEIDALIRIRLLNAEMRNDASLR